MFRIRRVYDDILPVNQTAIREVRQIFADQFPGAGAREIDTLAEKLRNPFKQRFRAMLYVAENGRGRVLGFAIVLFDPAVGFCFLDYLAAGKNLRGRGVGGALYQQVRDEAVRLGARGLFFETPPDETDPPQDSALRKRRPTALL